MTNSTIYLVAANKTPRFFSNFKILWFQLNAPPGTLATLNGLAGGAHFGFGKGMGGLVGGILKDQLGSTAIAFR